MKKLTCLILTLTVLLFACKKNNNNNNWTEEDQAFYNNVITLQDQAAVNYTTWLLTMDSMEVINKLQQFFLDDSTVTSATIGEQGIAVQYSNGMRGGIFLNPEDEFEVDTTNMVLLPKSSSSELNEKSLVNIKKAILLNPSYWERSENTNNVIASYNLNLPKAGFSLTNIYKGMDASVDRFTQLSGYGLIHVYTHGWAWPKKWALTEVYMMTGEKVSEGTSGKYWDDIEKGNIVIGKAKTYVNTINNVYFLSEKFVASRNDFSKDTVLFYGGFCYGFNGTWPEIVNTFAKGAYFGFSWRVETTWNCKMAKSLIGSLTDTIKSPPVNTENWFTNPDPPKKRWDVKDELYCRMEYAGDATLTLWKDSATVETSPITNITQTTATGGGNIKSDGGNPITGRGVCWSNLSKPTIADDYTSDGGGTGVFVCYLAGLIPDTLYYVRAYAINNVGILYGNEVTFRTLANPASTVTTALVTNITQTTATCGGNVTSDGGFPVTARGVCWSNLPDPTITNDHTTDGDGTGEFESSLSGLTLDTTYYVRAYATNSIGTVYGNQESFTTKPLYFIGQNYGGGIIFYIDGTKKHGLICASTDQSTGAEWGCVNTLIGGTSVDLGTGQANTTAIINGCAEPGIAARICDQYSVTVDDITYDDWYLPSIGELGQMAWWYGVIGGITPMATYWSSSEYDSYAAYCQVLSQGTVFTLAKDISWYYVRAVRAF